MEDENEEFPENPRLSLIGNLEITMIIRETFNLLNNFSISGLEVIFRMLQQWRCSQKNHGP